MSTARIPALALLALCLLGATTGWAQGSDVITGQVTDGTGAPVAAAEVTAVSPETGVRRSARTNQQGRFTIVFPDGAGLYQLTVAAAGRVPVAQVVRRLADEDFLVANVRLDAAPVLLEGLEVTARRQPDARGLQRDPNTQERVLSGEALDRLPIDPTDLTAIATLTPGVVLVGDSLSNGFSVLGHGPAGNQITLDGVSFGGGEAMGGGAGMGVPNEAVRVTRVITNSYDVSRGQFSGGQIATTTRSGTNSAQGSFTFNLRDPALQWTEANSAFDGSFRQSRISGGMGGPIIRDRLFYFASVSWQRRSEDLASLLSADDASLQRYGVSPDSVSRLLSLVASRGVYPTDLAIRDDRINDQLSFLGRADYNLNELHTLTLRLDHRRSAADAMGGGLGFPQAGSDSESSGSGAMLSLSSRFGNGWINELRAYSAREQRESSPYQVSPAGRVRVTSVLEDGSRSISNLSFGGGGMATESHSDNLEISDELSLLLGTTHRIRAGATFTSVRSAQEMGSNRFGTFVYQSLDDFEANRPASFTRSLVDQARESGGWNGALYLGDSWRPTQALQITMGARLETSRVAQRPEHNAAVEAAFGRRTDAIPTEVAVTPRAGFSYTLGGADGPPAGVIRGGLGAFRGSPSWGLFASARDLTGLPSALSQLYCVGAGVPVPDWELYLADPTTVPTSCVGEPGTGFSSGRGTTVALFDPDYRTPQSWRASLGFQRRLVGFVGASVDLTYAEGRYQQGVRDLNLREAPVFSLAQEGDRPVYVPERAIVARTGNVGFLASRRDAEFGQVLEVDSDLRSRTAQATLALNGFVPTYRLSFSGSYTHTRAEDQGSAGGWGAGGGFGGFRGREGGGGGLGSLPPTGGDPNQRSWARSDFDRRHAISGTLGRAMNSWLDLTVIGRATSGSPFSPLVGGDINGDGARNDLAFLFDPSTTADPALAAGIDRVLDGVPGAVRECVESQLRRIAGRNSCVQPWSYSLDLRLNVRPELPGLDRRVSFSIDAVNSLSGLDRLLHGSDGLRGWGQQVRVDPILLYPRGFDPATRSFQYEVNERFGTSRSRTQAFRSPFQIQIQGQVAVGRGRSQGGGPGRGGFDGGGGRMMGPGMGGGRPGGADPATLLARAFANPLARIVAMADSLALSAEQRVRLTAISDSLQQRQDSLRLEVTRAAGGGEMGEVFRAAQPRLQQSRREVAEALRRVQELLTPEQWARIPEPVRTPPRMGGPGGEGGAGRQDRRDPRP